MSAFEYCKKALMTFSKGEISASRCFTNKCCGLLTIGAHRDAALSLFLLQRPRQRIFGRTTMDFDIYDITDGNETDEVD